MDIKNKHITVLGSTGSVGSQTLDVARLLDLKVDAIAFGSNIQLGEEQIRAFRPKYAAIGDETAAKSLRTAVKDTDTRVLSGRDCICEMIDVLSPMFVSMALQRLCGATPHACRYPAFSPNRTGQQGDHRRSG